MVRTETVFKSSDNVHKVMVTIWAPDNKRDIKAILQIAHGMKEHMGRYCDFAQYLTDHGIAVIGNDHLGHGRSADNLSELGYFCQHAPSDVLVKDMYRLTKRIRKAFPNEPIFLLGHSMGSFLTRKYLTIYGSELSGVILSGTGCQPTIALQAGLLLTKIFAHIYGDKHRSNFITKIAFGGYNKRIAPEDTGNWLTKEQSIVDAYNSDPYCNYTFTLNGFRGLFETIAYIQKPANYTKTSVNIPIYIVSGEEDPVGNYGQGVKQVYDLYKKCGVKELDMKLYEGDRHELINETDRAIVYQDILNWINKHI